MTVIADFRSVGNLPQAKKTERTDRARAVLEEIAHQKEKVRQGQTRWRERRFLEIATVIVDEMDPTEVYTPADITIIVGMAGIAISYARPVLSFMVNHGLVERLAWGKYVLPAA